MNGLYPHVLYEWAEVTHMCRDDAAMRHLRNVFRALEDGQTTADGKRPYRLYAWNIINRRYEYLDGTVRNYVHASIRNPMQHAEGKQTILNNN